MRSLVGQQLGDYVLEAELGSGSMGAVYRATYLPQRSAVAIKVLLHELASDVSFITRFIREARIVSSLDHPNIVRVYDAGRQGEHIYFVMEYFPGATAGQILRERQRLPLEMVVEIAMQTADALAYAHREGRLVHRDIKPDNLLVNERCRVKVLDFGLARIEGARSITVAGTVVGSLYYVAPEQLLGHTLDGRADVYALGITMYEMLTGERPYRGHSLTEMSDAILSGTAIPPSQLVPSAPPEIEHIIARAMARSLDYRYRDAGELCRDLRNFQLQMSHISTAPLPLPSRPASSSSSPPMAPRPTAAMGQQHPQNPLRTAPPAPPSPPAPYPSQPTQRMPGANAPYQEPPRRQRDDW
ncbi:MAG TPA: serine/threonine-protein kinase [Ktedonobacterales bacterium]|nr:serine/threonine-protein kinase [Ktedonobacterales bacterium]